MKKYLIVAISLFLFIPVLYADDLPTYYDKEIIEINLLPAASENTLNKVYLVDKKYYVTNKIDGGLRPLQVGDSLKNVTLYFDFPDDYNLELKNKYICDSPNCTVPIIKDCIQNSDHSIYLRYDWYYSYRFYSTVHSSDYFYYSNRGNLQINLKSYSFINDSYNNSVCEILDNDVASHIKISLETTYSWLEVSKDQVIEYKVPIEDFYFFYSFEDIQKFNILSNYNLSNFNDFQKLVIVLGFNTFFLVFIGFIVYVLIKLINKGISILLD